MERQDSTIIELLEKEWSLHVQAQCKKASASSKELLVVCAAPHFEEGGNDVFVLLNNIAQPCIGRCRNSLTIASFVVKQCIHSVNIVSFFSRAKQSLVV